MKRQTKRSLAAKKAWATRRRREAAEHRRRSRAARKGWKRRKAKGKIMQAAKAQPKRKGRLAEFVMMWTYHGTKGTRTVDFLVIAKSTPDAELFVVKAVAAGEDSKGLDLTWMAKIPWDETTSFKFEDQHEADEKLDAKILKSLGEGYVEVR